MRKSTSKSSKMKFWFIQIFICGEIITIHFLVSNSTKNHENNNVAQVIGSTRKQNIQCKSIGDRIMRCYCECGYNLHIQWIILA